MGRDPPFALKAVKSRIERAVFHLQHVFGAALNVLSDLVAVSRTEYERAQNQHVQGALQNLNTIGELG